MGTAYTEICTNPIFGILLTTQMATHGYTKLSLSKEVHKVIVSPPVKVVGLKEATFSNRNGGDIDTV